MMNHRIIEKKGHVEIHLIGRTSKWEIIKIIFELQRNDPKKQRKGMWFLNEHVDFKKHSLPLIIKGIMNLVVRNTLQSGAKTAIIAANEQQHELVDVFCANAASHLPYPVKGFATIEEATLWLER